MLLDHSLAAPKAAEAVRSAVARVLAAGHRTADLLLPGQEAQPLGCAAMGARVLEALGAP
jgi:isocitrate/isopropylmalate dehydrogenase